MFKYVESINLLKTSDIIWWTDGMEYTIIQINANYKKQQSTVHS